MVWFWTFNSSGELRRALEEYTAFQDGTVVLRCYCGDAGEGISVGYPRPSEIDEQELARIAARYGLRLATDETGAVVHDADGYPVLEPDPEATANDRIAMAEMHAAQRRAEIDACMLKLMRVYPHMARLLDSYYRAGRSLEPRGWIEAARRFGLFQPKCPAHVRCPASPGDNRTDLAECRRAEKRRCHSARMMFEALLFCAVGRLFEVHKIRCGHAP